MLRDVRQWKGHRKLKENCRQMVEGAEADESFGTSNGGVTLGAVHKECLLTNDVGSGSLTWGWCPVLHVHRCLVFENENEK